jgi:mannose-1-phosphate guanylyltransferase/mannose-6-phosphate isomerase
LNVVPIILCGGAGTRLWPLSRELYPKQLLPLVDDNSLLQNTILRLKKGTQDPVLICNEEHRFLVAEQLREIGLDQATIMLEPEGRNTAPAVALGAHQVLADGDAVLLVLPSDHVIPDNAAFLKALADAVALAEQDYLVTFGVTPTRAETGYGYINAGDSVGAGQQVAAFVEKPDLATAEKYVASGNYFWNSGMFVFKASNYLAELARQRSDIADAVETSFQGVSKDDVFTRVDQSAFAACPKESIDYAVMENTVKAAMVPLDAGWSDIGSWDALWAVSQKDEAHNTLVGDVIVEDVNNSYVRAEHRLVSVVGVDDLVVVETADAVLVTTQNQAQHVKKIVTSLQSSEREERMTHRKVFRPWGNYEGIDNGDRYQVKRIVVQPGASLSLQKHHHRAEHWIVVRGTAQVTRGEEVFQLAENESTYIPIGTVHRLENPGRIPLEMIEVQSGSYLGEDDIVRLDDNYGR